MKCQTSAEFMIIFVLFLVIMSIILVFTWRNTVNIVQSKFDLEARRVLDDISNRIDTAFLEGDGFSINITVPQDILGTNFSLMIHENRVLLELRNNTYSRTLLTKNITGTLSKGVNVIGNTQGEIIISGGG